MMRICAPEQDTAEVAPVEGVVDPTGHAWQGGLLTVELPPAENFPVPQMRQLALSVEP